MNSGGPTGLIIAKAYSVSTLIGGNNFAQLRVSLFSCVCFEFLFLLSIHSFIQVSFYFSLFFSLSLSFCSYWTANEGVVDQSSPCIDHYSIHLRVLGWERGSPAYRMGTKDRTSALITAEKL